MLWLTVSPTSRWDTYYYVFKGVNAAGGNGGASGPVSKLPYPTSVSAPHRISPCRHQNHRHCWQNSMSICKAPVKVTTTLKFYWGDNDGGTTAAWDNTIAVDAAQPGNLIGEITSGLMPHDLLFRAKASNWVRYLQSISFTPIAYKPALPGGQSLRVVEIDDDTNATVKDSSGNTFIHGLLKNSSNTSKHHINGYSNRYREVD